MSEKTAVRFLGSAWGISMFSADAGSGLELSVKAPNIGVEAKLQGSTYCFSVRPPPPRHRVRLQHGWGLNACGKSAMAVVKRR